MSRISFSAKAAPYLYGVIALLIVVTMAVLYFRGLLLDSQITAALLAMLGTFLGALFAFRLNERKDDLKADKEHRRQLDLALFVLARQCSAIADLQKDLQKYEGEFERAFNCPAFRPPEYKNLSIDFSALSFLLDSHASLLLRLAIAEEGFHQAIYSLTVRNDFLIGEVHPAISSKGLNRKMHTMGEVLAALGERQTEGAVNMARVMYKLVDQANESLPLIHAELHAAAKALFKDFKFVTLVRIDESATGGKAA